MSIEFDRRVKVCKVSKKLGLVFGFAIITKVDRKPYFDTQADHIPDETMVCEALDFVKNGAVADDMHEKDSDHGYTPFIFPLTEEIADALGIETKKHGLLIAMKPGPEQLAKFEDGTYTSFSLGGHYGEMEFLEDD